MVIFYRGNFSLEVGGTNPRTNEKLLCKGEPYRFSSWRDPLLETKKDITDSNKMSVCI